MKEVNIMDYLFYLEPYTFLLCSNDKTVVYNTLNAAYLICPDYPPIQSIIDQWKNTTNGYSILLEEQTLTDETVKRFVDAVRDTFSGDCVEFDKEQGKPYIFQPTLFLNTDIRVKEEGKKTSLGDRIMENLHEVSLYLPAVCESGCSACVSYFHQMSHCAVSSEGILKIEDYHRLLNQLSISGVKRINLLAGGNPIGNGYISQLLPDFVKLKMKMHLYLDYAFLCKDYKELSQYTKCTLEVSVQPENFTIQLVEDMQEYSHDTIRWNLIVSDEKEMERLNELDIPSEVVVRVKPFYTGENLDFFKEYVFTDLEDILSTPVDRKTIFRHKVLNDNFFGVLSIFPSGEVYANVNCPQLGNIQESSLKELVYREVAEENTWLRVRTNEVPCNCCVNKDLCPSISNYELVIGRNNLCSLK